MKRIALMGGTFDPIHYGHLVAAEAALAEFCLDKVIFVPAGAPPHKTYRKVSNGVDRYLMTVMATITNPNFEVSSYEIDKKGPSYSIDTVKYFKELFPDTQLYFITGADAILEIYTWKQSKELLDICNFIAATRPGYNISDIENVLGDDVKKINFIEIPALAISSSDIRKRVEEKRPITYLLPESTANFIYKQALYLNRDN